MLVAEGMNITHDNRSFELYHPAWPVRDKWGSQHCRALIEFVLLHFLPHAYLEVRSQLAHIIGVGPQKHHYLGGGMSVRFFRFRANPVRTPLHALVQHDEVESRHLFRAHEGNVAAAVIPVGRSVMPGAFP